MVKMPKERASKEARAVRRNSSKPVHPGSRKAVQMMKQVHREEKMQKKKSEKKSLVTMKIAKLMWFRERIDESKKVYSCKDMCGLIEKYIQRFDDELEDIVKLQSGKACMAAYHRLQHASKEDTLRQIIQREIQLFQSSGFEAPDLTNSRLFTHFLEWQGEENQLPSIALKKYTSSSTELK